MNDKPIHACLDGEISRESLSDAEQSKLGALEVSLDRAIEALRTAPTPDLTERVLGGLPAASPGKRLLGWLLRPVVIQLRPAYALAGIATVLVVGSILTPHLTRAPDHDQAITEAAERSRMYVQFRLNAPGASTVAVAGSFTGWQPEYELSEIAPGIWSVMVPLAPGVYDYSFVVDGKRMVVDPYAPRVADSFGGSNSRLFLLAPGDRV
jgi:hypothetical protein